MRKSRFALIALAGLTGCVGASFNPYIGQQYEWPTGSSAIVVTHFDMPIYKSMPERAYHILGEITLEKSESTGANLDMRSPMTRIIRKAKEVGADALVVVEPKKFFSYATQITEAPETAARSRPAAIPDSYAGMVTEIGRGRLSVLAIKWRHAEPEPEPEPQFEEMPPTEPAAPEEPPVAEPPVIEEPITVPPTETEEPAGESSAVEPQMRAEPFMLELAAPPEESSEAEFSP